MNYKTHLAFGIFVSLLVLKVIHIENQILFVIICAFFALLPDIDQSRSKFGRQFRPLSFVLKHRGLMHSIWV
ncbi:MAG: metal-dependent hydrolase, partial [Nanoarchaeota archaeon]|nr:metal-dependent hydrolase [Nanoarchaeota archaeon]